MAASGTDKKAKTARKLVRMLDEAVSLAVLAVLLLLMGFGIYCLWDAKQLYHGAEPEKYEVYKPGGDSLSFEELKAINPDVFGWLTVYGTAVDYPLLQGEDNLVYLNTDAEGNYSLTGSIYLDSRCAKDFSDYNNIIHGHHMAASAMFGDLSKFADKAFFDSHEYGNLYVDGRNYGIVFFGFALVDSYDKDAYSGPVSGAEAQAAFLARLEEKTMYLRPAEQQSAGHILILSTCSSDITNGRHILLGYLTEECYADPYYVEKAPKPVHEGIGKSAAWNEFAKLPLWLSMLLLLALLIIVYIVFELSSKRLRQKRAYRERACKKEG